MAKRASISCYDQVVDITLGYLGPAANRFIDRQIENHLHKSPDQLSPTDLLDLTDWIRVAVSLLTEDMTVIESYIGELKKLAKSYSSPKRKLS